MIDFEFLEVFEPDLSRVVWLLTFNKEVQELCLTFNEPEIECVVNFFALANFNLFLLAFDYDAVEFNAYVLT